MYMDVHICMLDYKYTSQQTNNETLYLLILLNLEKNAKTTRKAKMFYIFGYQRSPR